MRLLASTEAELLRRARGGDLRAFDRLFVLHRDAVYACLYQQLNSDVESVEDALGAVFLNAFLSLPRFEGKASFATYLYKIALNEARCQRKRRLREQTYRQDDGFEIDSLPGSQRTTEHIVLQAAEYQSLLRSLYSVPEPYRTPLLRRCQDCQNSVEIARDLGRPEGTVRFQIRRGLQILRERLPEDNVKRGIEASTR